MAGFGKRGIEASRADDFSSGHSQTKQELKNEMVSREGQFAEDSEQNYAAASYTYLAILSLIFYGFGHFFFGFTDEQKITVLPLLSIGIAYAVLSVAWAFASGFKGDPNSKDNKARYPAAAFIGIGVGIVYALIKHDLSMAEFLGIDWYGELFSTHTSLVTAESMSFSVIKTISSGAGFTVAAYALLDRFILNRQRD